MHFRCTARARPSRSGPDETKERSLHRGGGDGGGYVGFTGGFRLLWPQERQLVFTVVRKFSSSSPATVPYVLRFGYQNFPIISR